MDERLPQFGTQPAPLPIVMQSGALAARRVSYVFQGRTLMMHCDAPAAHALLLRNSASYRFMMYNGAPAAHALFLRDPEPRHFMIQSGAPAF